MCKKEMPAVVLGLFLLIVSGCSDISVNEETTEHNNSMTIENSSNENTTIDGDDESENS